jgi:hypothetical protein
MTALDDLLDQLATTRVHNMRNEIERLRAIEAWARTQLPIDYKTGDRVVIVTDRPTSPGGGWAQYAEALQPGQTGIAGESTIHPHNSSWRVLVGLDRCWSAHPRNDFDRTVDRYWEGPADQTPDGYRAPSRYDQERHPNGKISWFSMDVAWVKRAASDQPGPQPLNDLPQP